MANKPEDESILVAAAKTIGKAAGTVASLTGIEKPAPPPKKTSRKPKLAKKEKAHLPRKVKKAQKKARAAG
jgi:hypothetical protein